MFQTRKLKSMALAAVILGGGAGLGAAFPDVGAEAPSVPSAERIRDHMTLPHFSRISGIAGELSDAGASIPAALGMKTLFATTLVEQKRESYADEPDMVRMLDMAHSEGRTETRDGEWTVEALEDYVDAVVSLDQRFGRIVSSAKAYMQDEGIPGQDADHYVRRSIALAVGDHLEGRPGPEAESDDRMQVRHSRHAGIVNDLHGRIHAFFTDRLTDLDHAGIDWRMASGVPRGELEGNLPDPDGAEPGASIEM